jgi:hypothetical protein
MSAELVAQRILWFLPMLLQLGAATLMVRRRLHRELPMFFAFMLYDSACGVVAWLLRGQMPEYFYFYWIAEAMGAALGFAVIYEIFFNVVKRYETIHRFGFLLYRWAAVILLVFATITAATAPGIDSARIIEGILTLERGVRIVQAGLLLVLFLFASYLGLSWRSNVFGVALGFGMYATVDLALVAVFAHAGASANQLYVWAKPLAYNLMTLIWAVYMLQPQTTTQAITSLPKTEMAVWDQTLVEYLRR